MKLEVMNKKINEIVNGWKNLAIKDEEIERIAKHRLSICNTCEHKETMIGLEVCGHCHCVLEAKARSLESKCPEKKWV